MLKSDTNGFTLIELLLGVTLSAILMMGIVVFVSGTLGSNLATKRTLEDVNKNDSFEQRFMSVLGNITNSGIYASGGTFGGNYNTGIFLSTGGSNLTVTFLGLKTQTGYCDSYSGSASETGTVMLLSLRQFATPSVQNTIPYTISSSENSIFSGTIRVIGTGYPGNDLDTTSGALSELSSPSALVVSGALLYIADTMNDRILSYDTSAGTIQKLLGRENGIEKPTSLFFSGSTLLIASTGNGKIYSLRDGEGNGQTFSSKFHVATDFSANIIRFTFPDIPAITLPSISGDFAFRSDGIPFGNPVNDLVNTGAYLQYTFSGGLQSYSTGNVYQFSINNISPTPTGSGNHIVTISFLSGSTIQYGDVFHYYSKGDGSLESSTGNILDTLTGGFIYPHNITGANSWSGTIDWNNVLGNNPPGEEVLSSLPVQDLSFSNIGKILTIRYHEYIQYDCLLGKHKVEEKIQKILLP